MPDDKQTIITPSSGGGSAGWAVAIVILIVVIAFLVIVGLPRLRGRGGTNINVPEKIEINTNPQTS